MIQSSKRQRKIDDAMKMKKKMMKTDHEIRLTSI